MTQSIANLFTLAAIAGSVVIRMPFDRRRRHNTIVTNRAGPVEIELMILVTIGLMVIPVVFATTHLLDFADVRFVPVVAGLGVALLPPALWLFWRSHRDLGEHWSPTLHVHAEQTLVTRGLYARIRHPMYTAIWLWSFAQMLLLQNWIAGPAALATFAAMYLIRVPREESMMEARFGDAYREYRAHTDRLVPGVW